MPVTFRGTTLRNTTYLSQWSPQQLFTSNEQGVWFDPSDMSTMFQDAGGTIPVTAMEQPVGLILDKSKGLLLGSEVITNGTFDNGTTNWSSIRSTLSVSNGQLLITGDPATIGFPGVYQSFPTVAGRSYRVSFNIVSVGNFGLVKFAPKDGTNDTGTALADIDYTTTGTKTAIIRAISSNSTFYILAQVASTTAFFTIDNISVREISGNHASQSTAASRPVLSARYNLLTKTEEFDNVAWYKTSAISIQPNNAISPNGTNTADLITYDGTTFSIVSQVATVTSGTNHIFTVYVKDINSRYVYLSVRGNTNDTYASIEFDLTSVTTSRTITAGSGWSVITNESSITPVGNSWYLCKLVMTAGTVTNGIAFFGPSYNFAGWTDGGYPGTFAGTRSLLFWGADLRVANDGVGIPAYQRVGAAVTTTTNPVVTGTPDYDTNGFPPYLRFDGIDDSLSTLSINFANTDKMSVFVGIRKLSDSNMATLVELSASSDAPNTFGLNAPGSSPSKYIGISRGTSAVFPLTNDSQYSAPHTGVISFINNISGDFSVIRINNTQAAQSTGDQGTGNFSNAPIYIGSRAGILRYYNGRLYSLIICGALEGSGEINNTETWINNKTRAY